MTRIHVFLSLGIYLNSFIKTHQSVFLFLFIGKGLGIWDTYSHAGKVYNNDTGDVACDSYHKYHEDIKIMSDMKVIIVYILKHFKYRKQFAVIHECTLVHE